MYTMEHDFREVMLQTSPIHSRKRGLNAPFFSLNQEKPPIYHEKMKIKTTIIIPEIKTFV
jgi:hypothetical protein